MTEASGVEAELDDLQRRYRMMEGDRKAYADEVQVGRAAARARASRAAPPTPTPAPAARPPPAQNVLRKQRSHIDKLAKENGQLKAELSLETRAAAMGGAVRLTSQLTKMADAGEQHTRRIELERQRAAELDAQLKALQDSVQSQRVAMGGIHAPAASDHAVDKTIRVLEHRLDTALLKFNEVIAQNKALHESIENLRRERGAFDLRYKRQQRELAERKRAMADVIEQANVSYEERDRLLAEAARARAATEAEAREFEEEWKRLGDILAADLQQHEALSRQTLRQAPGGLDGGGGGLLWLGGGEAGYRAQARRQSWGPAGGAEGGAADEAGALAAALATVRQRTGVSDLDELVARFVETEAQTFALFNQLNELTAAADAAEAGLGEARREIERQRGAGQGADGQRRRHAAELEAKVRAAEGNGEAFNAKWTAASELVARLGGAVEEACSRIGCNLAFLKEVRAPAPRLRCAPTATPGGSAAVRACCSPLPPRATRALPAGRAAQVGGEEGVTESNMMVYLGVIEQRTNELLRLHAQLGAGEAEAQGGSAQGGSAQGEGGGPDGGGSGLQIEVSEHDDDNRTFLTSGAPLSARVRARDARPRPRPRPASHPPASAAGDAPLTPERGPRSTPPHANFSLHRCHTSAMHRAERPAHRLTSPLRWRPGCPPRARAMCPTTTTTTTATTTACRSAERSSRCARLL